MLTNIGVPETKVPQAKTPPIPDFNIPQAKPLREALLKLKVCKETVNKLNQPYISRVNEHRSETIRTLQLLWGRLHEEGAYSPSRAWEKVLLLAQRKTQETLDDLFNMVVSLARNHVTNLATKKRKSQPVFDQVSIRACLFTEADWVCSVLSIFSSGISPIQKVVRTLVRMRRRNSLFALV